MFFKKEIEEGVQLFLYEASQKSSVTIFNPLQTKNVFRDPSWVSQGWYPRG